MDSETYGQFIISMSIATSIEMGRSKIVRVMSTFCDRGECEKLFAQFREMNPAVGQLSGEFISRDYIH